MIAVIEYGCGNLFSLSHSLSYLGEDVVVSGDAAVIRNADRIILPGVGAFGAAADKLRDRNLIEVIRAEAEKGKPLLGVCLGMQLLFEKSYEFGEHAGLGLIPGEVVSMTGLVPASLKLPQMGWNALDFPKDKPKHTLFSQVSEGECVYFVHSYCGVNCADSLIASTEYGAPITAAVAKDNVIGVQFHPEKSGKTGLAILRAFCTL